MPDFSSIADWISGNEALLSGLVALAVLAGLVLNPVRRAAAYIRSRSVSRKGTGLKPSTTVASAITDDLDEPLLAVLAFDNLSSDEEMQFFSDGVSEEIIQRISRGTEIKVIGKTSSFQFRGERKAEACAELRCSHLLDGSIRRAAARVRVAAHLVDARNSTTLWSESYDRQLDDIFAIQEDISAKIADSLRLTITGAATDRIDPADYDLYLRSSPVTFAPDELRASVALLEVVTARSPRFAEAWGRLAYLRAFLSFYRPYAERALIKRQVEDEAARALALDSGNPDALSGMVFVVKPFGEFVEYFRLLDRLRLNAEATKTQYVSWGMRTGGFVEQSVVAAQEAYRLNALDPMAANGLALAMLAAGRLDEAVPIYRTLVETNPGMSFPLASLLRVHAFRQDWHAVDELLALAAKRDLREFEDGLKFIHAKRDPSPAAIAGWRRSIDEQIERTGRIDLSRLVYAAHLGLVDAAYDAIARVSLGPAGDANDVMGPDAYRTSILFQANMPELRNDARFPALCARLGLVELWTARDQWPDCADDAPYDFRAECRRFRDLPKEECAY